MIKLYSTILIPLFGMLILSGCTGPAGPAGEDALGKDALPPTIRLEDPLPFQTCWDTLTLKAAAADNVTIDRVVFLVNGSPELANLSLVASEPPYRFVIPFDQLLRSSDTLPDLPPPVRLGWNFISARAYDPAGNMTEAPPSTVFLGRSKMLSDTTVTLGYANWMVSDSLILADTAATHAGMTRSNAYWVRFNAAKTGKLLSLTLFAGGDFGDSTRIKIAIWSGSGIPRREDTTFTISGSSLRGAVSSRTISMGSGFDLRSSQYYLVIEWDQHYLNDRLYLGVDDGVPPWNRSGYRDIDGLGLLSERFGMPDNILASCQLHYPAVR